MLTCLERELRSNSKGLVARDNNPFNSLRDYHEGDADIEIAEEVSLEK